MERLSVWVSAGLLSAGVSAAVLAGAGVAVADDTASASEPGSSSSPASDTGSDTTPDTAPDTTPGADAETEPEEDNTAEEDELEPAAGEDADEQPAAADRPEPPERKKRPHAVELAVTKPDTDPEPAVEITEPELDNATEPVVDTPLVAPATSAETRATTGARIAAQPTMSMAMAVDQPTVEKASAPRIPNLLRWVQGVADNIVKGVGSLVINTIQALEALLTGPPAVPASYPVTVRSSSLLLANGQRVQANWYFPDVPEGAEPPERMILLQHGFFALGPMYSHTAADLAVRTNSIVVTPSLSSNFLAGDDHWLGGDGMASAIAHLFADDRAALTASAHAAGFVGVLPQKFGLAGHSLGGRLVAATAGYLVDNGAADNLVGVTTLDGVPTGSVMAVALAKLQAYEDATTRYIPVREIGAPSNNFNSAGNVKEALNAARPGRFNGVVLTGGVHMDSMRGGNPLIQFAAYLAAGFPKPQNQQAVTQLSAQWFNEWFAGDTDNGDELVPGSTVPISTPSGTAHGVVIASVPALRTVTSAV